MKKRVDQLDGLRFIFCVIIIFSHFDCFILSNWGEVYNNYLHNPTMAVDYFFMLSGFEIFVSMYAKEICSGFKDCILFACNRIKRIYPAYVISLTIGLLYELIFYHDSLKTIVKTFMFLGVDLTLLQSITGMQMFTHAINGVCWFLSSLFVCYIICPLFLKLVKKVTAIRQIVFAIFITISVIYILSKVAEIIEGDGSVFNQVWYSHPVIRCFYVLLGMFVGRLYNELQCKKINLDFAEIGITLISIAYILLRNALIVQIIPNKSTLRIIDVSLCLFLLLVFSCSKGVLSQLLSKKTITDLGKDSLYLYLFHFPFRKIVFEIFRRFNLVSYTGEFGYILQAVLIVICSAVSLYLCRKYMSRINAIFDKILIYFQKRLFASKK